MKLLGMEIDTHKLADTAMKVGTSIVVAAVAHKAITGKLDIKGALVNVVRDELQKRPA